MNECQKRAWRKYVQTEKGQATIKRYVNSEKGKACRKRYQQSEKFKQRRREHPEIYTEPQFTHSVARLLHYQEQLSKEDPESLTPDFICSLIRIKKE